MKKDNNGFSLVEMIVVVLIIAIIAVALAPQVIRWVENSRIASDLETKEGIEKMCQYALTDEDIFKEVKDGGYTITIEKDSTGTHVTCASTNPSASPTFWDKFFEMGGYADLNDFESSVVLKSTPVAAPKIELIVYVYEDGHTYSTLTGFASAEIED
jgi:prepilin-type N-terminal cleavage/methylation domain-containing protein